MRNWILSCFSCSHAKRLRKSLISMDLIYNNFQYGKLNTTKNHLWLHAVSSVLNKNICIFSKWTWGPVRYAKSQRIHMQIVCTPFHCYHKEKQPCWAVKSPINFQWSFIKNLTKSCHIFQLSASNNMHMVAMTSWGGYSMKDSKTLYLI